MSAVPFPSAAGTVENLFLSDIYKKEKLIFGALCLKYKNKLKHLVLVDNKVMVLLGLTYGTVALDNCEESFKVLGEKLQFPVKKYCCMNNLLEEGLL